MIFFRERKSKEDESVQMGEFTKGTLRVKVPEEKRLGAGRGRENKSRGAVSRIGERSSEERYVPKSESRGDPGIGQKARARGIP